MPIQYHTKIDKGDIAPYVLLPGDPKRVPIVASFWDEAHLIADNREHVTYTGKYKGLPISCTSTGMGCPSTGIALEELARCGATTFIRIGTCGTFQSHVKVGDLLIFDSACRYDGASKAYTPIEFPAVASHEVVEACIQAAKNLKIQYFVGTTRSADTFYASHPKPGSSFNNFWQSNWSSHFDDLRRLNVLGAEMESSIIFVLSRVWGLRAGSMAVALDNMFEVTNGSAQFDPETSISHDESSIKKLCLMGCETIKQLYELDSRKSF